MKTIQAMKTRTALLLVVAFLLVGGTALAQTGGPGPVPAYVVQAGTITGGDYQLTSLAWRVSGAAGGGSYALAALDEPSLRGNGCCCTFLPLVLRSSPSS